MQDALSQRECDSKKIDISRLTHGIADAIMKTEQRSNVHPRRLYEFVALGPSSFMYPALLGRGVYLGHGRSSFLHGGNGLGSSCLHCREWGQRSGFWASNHISTSFLINKRRLPTRNDGGIGMPMHRRFLAVWSEILNILLISESVKVSIACPKKVSYSHQSGCYGLWQTESTAISGHLISCHSIWTKLQ